MPRKGSSKCLVTVDKSDVLMHRSHFSKGECHSCGDMKHIFPSVWLGVYSVERSMEALDDLSVHWSFPQAVGSSSRLYI